MANSGRVSASTSPNASRRNPGASSSRWSVTPSARPHVPVNPPGSSQRSRSSAHWNPICGSVRERRASPGSNLFGNASARADALTCASSAGLSSTPSRSVRHESANRTCPALLVPRSAYQMTQVRSGAAGDTKESCATWNSRRHDLLDGRGVISELTPCVRRELSEEGLLRGERHRPVSFVDRDPPIRRAVAACVDEIEPTHRDVETTPPRPTGPRGRKDNRGLELEPLAIAYRPSGLRPRAPRGGDADRHYCQRERARTSLPRIRAPTASIS